MAIISSSVKQSLTCVSNQRASASFLRGGNLLTACLISVTVLMVPAYLIPPLPASGEQQQHLKKRSGVADGSFWRRPEGHIFSFSNLFCKMKRCDLSNCWPFSYWDSVKSDRNHSIQHFTIPPLKSQIPIPTVNHAVAGYATVSGLRALADGSPKVARCSQPWAEWFESLWDSWKRNKRSRFSTNSQSLKSFSRVGPQKSKMGKGFMPDWLNISGKGFQTMCSFSPRLRGFSLARASFERWTSLWPNPRPQGSLGEMLKAEC